MAENVVYVKEEHDRSTSEYSDFRQLICRFCPRCDFVSYTDKKKKLMKRSCHKCEAKLNYRCLECNNQYTAFSTIVSHVKTKHGLPTLLSCSLCNFTTNNKAYLRGHIRACHTSPNISECGKCLARFKNTTALKKHISYCEITPEITCHFCSYKTLSKTKFVSHLQTHSSDGFRPSSEADTSNSNVDQTLDDFAEARETVHIKEEPDLNKSGCSDVMPLVCRFCLKCNDDVPIEKHEKKSTSKPCQKCGEDLKYKCLKCNTKYMSYNTASKHVQKKCGAVTRYNCTLCDYTSTCKSNLARHTVDVHSKANAIECKDCGKKLKNMSVFKKHVVYCGKSPHLFCNFCYYKTSRKFSLVRHLEMHESNGFIILSKEFKSANKPKSLTEFVLASEVVYVKEEHDQNTINNEVGTPDHTGNYERKVNRNSIDNQRIRRAIGRFCSKCNEPVETDEKKSLKKSCQKCGSNLVYQCLKCKTTYIPYSSIWNHIKRNCVSVTRHKCSVCNYESPFKSEVEKHAHLHSIKNTVQCDKCRLRLKTIKALKRHLLICQEKQGLISDSRTLRQTWSTDPNNTNCRRQINRYCKNCQKNIACVGFRGKKVCPTCDSKLLFQCKSCDLMLKSYKNMFYHIKDKCPSNGYVKVKNADISCAYCPYKAKYKSRIERHVKKHLHSEESCLS